MTDEKLKINLRRMGLDAASVQLVALLPLVEVAWSDGKVQEGERARIIEAARTHGLADEAGLVLLNGWLTESPSDFFLDTGRKILVEFSRRQDDGIGNEGIVALCWSVASSAGGLFGYGTVSSDEREAIARIADLLNVPADLDWRSVLQTP